MDLVVLILIILAIITTIIGCFAAVLQCRKIDQEEINDKFKKSVNEIVNEMSNQFNNYIENQKKDMEDGLKDAMEQYQIRKKNINEQLTLLNEDLKKAKVRHDEQLKELETQTTEIVNNRAKLEAAQVQSVIDYYQNQQAQITKDFNEFKEEIEEKRSVIIEELNKEKKKQQEIIEQHKREEEIKQNQNFYRIVVSENDQNDVKKLKSIAEDLHNPTVLYKLIYKTYYERPLNELIGRIVKGKDNTGIYKITSLKNGRVYIGQTKQKFSDRLRTHVKRGLKAEVGTSNKLYSAMWEDGVENFTFEILSTCSVSELNKKEKEFIEFYNADTWGYNSTKGNSN